MTCVFNTDSGKPLVQLRNNPCSFSPSVSSISPVRLRDLLKRFPDVEDNDLDEISSCSDTVPEDDSGECESESDDVINFAVLPVDKISVCLGMDFMPAAWCNHCQEEILAGQVAVKWETGFPEFPDQHFKYELHAQCCLPFSRNTPMGNITTKMALALVEGECDVPRDLYRDAKHLVQELLNDLPVVEILPDAQPRDNLDAVPESQIAQPDEPPDRDFGVESVPSTFPDTHQA